MPRICCRSCYARNGVKKPATQTQDRSGTWSEALCADCVDARAEASWESFLGTFYGSAAPVTVTEQMDAAHRQRREIRRKPALGQESW